FVKNPFFQDDFTQSFLIRAVEENSLLRVEPLGFSDLLSSIVKPINVAGEGFRFFRFLQDVEQFVSNPVALTASGKAFPCLDSVEDLLLNFLFLLFGFFLLFVERQDNRRIYGETLIQFLFGLVRIDVLSHYSRYGKE